MQDACLSHTVVMPRTDPLETIEKRLQTRKSLLILAASLCLVGAWGWRAQASLARVEDVQQARGIAADRSMQVESEVSELASRTAVVEAAVLRMQATLDRIDRQLWEVAKTTGAKPVGVKP